MVLYQDFPYQSVIDININIFLKRVGRYDEEYLWTKFDIQKFSFTKARLRSAKVAYLG